MDKIFEFLKKHIEWVMIITLFASVISPILFTRHLGLIEFDASTGAIGDTIGGLTAPFINFLGIILLYLTLREQTQSSKKQKDFESINLLFNTIKTDLENFKYYKKDELCFLGTKAIFEVVKDLNESDSLTNRLNIESFNAVHMSIMISVINVQALLTKNFASSLDIGEKRELHNSFIMFYSPIYSMLDAISVFYGKNKDVGNKQVMDLMKATFFKKFNDCKP